MNLSNPESPSAPEKRANGLEKPDLVKLWGPVEGYLRRNVVPEAFDELYAGTRILAIDAEAVTLAVQQNLITHDGGKLAAASLMAERIENSRTGLLRGRKVRLVSIESVVEEMAQ